MNRPALTTRFVGGGLAVVILTAATERVARTGAKAQETAVFRPTLAVPEMLGPS